MIRIRCWICSGRFTPLGPADLTCSASCEAQLVARREDHARAKRLCDAVFGKRPTKQPVRFALAETRARIAQLHSEGRRARITQETTT